MAEWTIKRCLEWTIEYLGGKGDENPRLSAEWLLTSATGLPRIRLYTDYDKPLTPEELSRLHGAVVRRAKGEPLQYIAGETSFRTITVACEPGVLIPRPETEMLVEEVLAYIDRAVLGSPEGRRSRSRAALPWNAEVEAARRAELEAAARRAAEQEGSDRADGDAGEGSDAPASDRVDAPASDAVPGAGDGAAEGQGDPGEACGAPCPTDPEDAAAPAVARVLEVGCGTGCISLSIAAERPGRVRCVSTDIEPRAVALARRNRDALGIPPEEADFREGNLVSPLDRATEWGTFDVLVSNPPYIPTSVMAQLPREVADFEPGLALEGGADGLDIFRRLVNAAPSMLRPGGLLACELHETTLDAAADICRAAGFEDVRIVDDLAGRPRIVVAVVPESAVLEARRRFGAGSPGR